MFYVVNDVCLLDEIIFYLKWEKIYILCFMK